MTQNGHLQKKIQTDLVEFFGEIGDQNSPLLNEGRRICKKSNPVKVYLQNSNLVETTRYLQNCYAKVIFFATHS